MSIFDTIKTGPPRGLLSRLMAPGFGWCSHCGTTWAHVASVDVNYGPGQGCFALCDECWSILTVAQRKDYYIQLLKSYYDKPSSGPQIPFEVAAQTLISNIEKF